MKRLLFLIVLSAASIVAAAEGRALLREGAQHTGQVSIKDGRCTIGGSGGISPADLVFVKFPAARIPTEIDQGLILTNGDLIAGDVTIGEDRRVTGARTALSASEQSCGFLLQVLLLLQTSSVAFVLSTKQITRA